MELNTVLELVKAGFTKDEIAQLEQQAPANADPEPVQVAMDLPPQNPEPAPTAQQVVAPVAVAEPAPAPVPAPVPQPVQTPPQDQPTMADLMQSIAKLTSAVQANAIAHSVMPNGVNQPSAEDMLAEIIRPTYKERS